MNVVYKYSRQLIGKRIQAETYSQMIRESEKDDQNLEKIKETFRLKRKNLRLLREIEELEELIELLQDPIE